MECFYSNLRLRNSCPLVLTVRKCRTRRITISSVHKNKRPSYTGYTIHYSVRMPVGDVYVC